ncbi:endo-beta-D-1,4-glucanase [Sporodiniella umbellata]|nr:endo-beta-D-1,4-glucanase [Sporodiniella umbellata]
MKFLSITTSAVLTAVISAGLVHADSCSKTYYQCGGKNWDGPTCCEPGSKCVSYQENPYYSQCVPEKHATHTANHDVATKNKTSKVSTIITQTKKSTKTTNLVKKTTTTGPSKATKTPKPSTSASVDYSAISGGASGNGETTRYWDCCKPSCSWPGKASVSSPVGSCNKDGKTLADSNVQNGCVGGSSYTCNNNQPWVVNDNLAYGFAAASIAGGNEATWCCACFELTFTSTTVKNKKMVVQVTNTGSDLGTNTGAHFDLQMPGGGVGIYNGCQTQWNAPSDGWGQRYGGISSVSDCSALPYALQEGCKWRFGWFKNADNPTMTYKQVTCPKSITEKSGCSRK